MAITTTVASSSRGSRQLWGTAWWMAIAVDAAVGLSAQPQSACVIPPTPNVPPPFAFEFGDAVGDKDQPFPRVQLPRRELEVLWGVDAREGVWGFRAGSGCRLSRPGTAAGVHSSTQVRVAVAACQRADIAVT